MALDKRVEMLEKEVEVLKHQIQSTLLDIKEHLLTNTYANLRADSGRPHDMGFHSEHMPSVAAQANPALSSFDDNVPIRRVSFDSLHDMLVSQPEQIPAEAHSPKHAENNARATMTQRENWVASRVQEIGPERTRELIRRYANNGQFDAGVDTTLLQLTDRYEVNHRNHKSSSQQQQTQLAKPQSQAKKKQIPMKDPNRKPSNSAQPTKKRQAKKQKQQTVEKAAPKPFPKKKTAVEDNGEGIQRSNLILRLIAGVQNAGAGVKWNKKHG